MGPQPLVGQENYAAEENARGAAYIYRLSGISAGLLESALHGPLSWTPAAGHCMGVSTSNSLQLFHADVPSPAICRIRRVPGKLQRSRSRLIEPTCLRWRSCTCLCRSGRARSRLCMRSVKAQGHASKFAFFSLPAKNTILLPTCICSRSRLAAALFGYVRAWDESSVLGMPWIICITCNQKLGIHIRTGQIDKFYC